MNSPRRLPKMVGGAVVILVASLVAPATLAFWINMAVLTLVAMVAVLYSFVAYRKQERVSGSEQAARS